MTAKDSKSTPKKAEDATRHPLALLADGWEARARLLTENARTEQSEQSARYYAARAAEAQDCAAQLREALRAQVEAEAGLRVALASVSDQAKGAFTDAAHAARSFDPSTRRVVRSLHRIHETARAALAQAGGEG